MRSTTKDEYADDRGCAVGLATDDEEKGSTYGRREAKEKRSNYVALRFDNRDAQTDYKAAHDYSDTYDMAINSLSKWIFKFEVKLWKRTNRIINCYGQYK